MSKPGSLPRHPPANGATYEWTCSGCGTAYLSKSASCPRCGSGGGKRGYEELTKKVVDDNDLLKGGTKW